MRVVYLIVLVFVAGSVYAAGLADADYTTPSNWSQNITPNGMVKSIDGIDVLGGSFKFSTTSRYRLDFNDLASDQQFFQYVRTSYTDLQLGDGTFSANLFMRVGKDLDGHNGRQWGDKRYYFYNDILGAESRNNDWAPRFYQGNITFDNVVRGTKLTIGRQYAVHLNNFQLDGGNLDVSLLDGRLGFFVYGGLPVSYFADTKKSYLVGGGIEVKPHDSIKLRGEYVYSDVLGDRVNVVKVRADYNYKFGNAYAQYGNNNGGNFYELGTVFRWVPSKTTVSLVFEQLLEKIGSGDNYYSNPLSYVLSPYGRYIRGKVRVQQGITDFLIVGGGVEVKSVSGGQDYDNRDYARLFGNVDIVRLPFEGTYLSVNVDYWDIPSGSQVDGNGQLTFGAQLTQAITADADLWLGTSFDRYRYDMETGKFSDWARSYYIGTQWRINKTFAVTADFTYEDSRVLNRSANQLTNNFSLQAWLNIAF